MTDKKVHFRIKSGQLAINPPFVTIKTSNHDQVVWRGHGGKIEIDFDKGQGTPFSASSFSAADETDKKSGQAVVRPHPKKRFKYTAYLTLPDGTVLKKDPGVDVDGGGPPGGPKKAARKKSARKKAARKPRRRTAKKAARKRTTRKKK